VLRIAGGRVYDPANGIAGEVRDVCVQDGKIVADVPGHARSIDARGMVVMPGGVDIHAHIAGPAVNAARKLAPEEHRADVLERTAIARSGSGGTVPSTFATGYRYALLGYTTVVDAATPPLAARHTLAELRDTPVIDAAFLVLMGNNLPLFELIREDPGRVREAVAWFLQATGGYGVKLVNPGGVEMWKRTNGNVTSLDDEGPGVPAKIKEAIFEPFRQGSEVVVHAPGVGIGLSLVARFADLHGGRAWVDDRVGGGASFKVLLPDVAPDGDGDADGEHHPPQAAAGRVPISSSSAAAPRPS